MKKILINDLLGIKDEDISNVRIKLNIDNGYTDPLEEYKQDPDKVNVDWFLWHNQRRYFHKGNIAICLLYLYNDKWLLTTIKKITEELDVIDGVGYTAEEVEDYSSYFGRLVIKYHNTNRSMGRTYDSLMDELEVLEVLPVAYDGDEFPGYENIRLSYAQLKTIIERKRSGWLVALNNQKAVYLITDKKTGKLYVGSANGNNEGLWQRWASYADIHNLTGGNKVFEEMKEECCNYIIDNFTYSILEIFDMKTDKHYILDRESFWKKVLKTKEYGMNCN